MIKKSFNCELILANEKLIEIIGPKCKQGLEYVEKIVMNYLNLKVPDYW